MNRYGSIHIHSLNSRCVLVGTVLLVYLCLSGPRVCGQDFPSSSDELLQRAKATFNDETNRAQLAAARFRERSAQANSYAWFNGFNGTLDAKMYRIQASKALKRPNGQLFSIKDSAQPGDVIRVYSGSEGFGLDIKCILVYVGEEFFPDAQDKNFSFFIYPYDSRLEYNTLPARIHDQFLEARANTLIGQELLAVDFPLTDPDDVRKVRWERPAPFHKSVFLRSNYFHRTGISYDIYRVDNRGRFVDFLEADLPTVTKANQDAAVLNQLCVDALTNPDQTTIMLATRCFAIEGGDNRAVQLQKIRANLVANAKVLKDSCRYAYAPGDAIVLKYVGGTLPPRINPNSTTKLGTNFFDDTYKQFHGTTTNRSLFQSSVLLHEALHLVCTSTEAEEDDPNWFQGHWGGIIDYTLAKYDNPVPLGIRFDLAVRNPYCYQYFAIWLSQNVNQP